MSSEDFFSFWSKINWVVVFGTVLVIGSFYIFLHMSHNKGSKFDFAEMFLGEDGKSSMGKFLAFIGGLAATWLVVSKAEDLTEGFFGLYLVTLVAGKVASEFVAAKKIEAKDKVNAGISDAPPAEPTKMDLQMSVTTPADPAPPTERRPLGKRPVPRKE